MKPILQTSEVEHITQTGMSEESLAVVAKSAASTHEISSMHPAVKND
jgi:hypothetical protein